MTDRQYWQRATHAVRTGIDTDTQHGAVVPQLCLSSTFRFTGLGEKGPYDYTRSGNPTRDQLATAIARLEGAEHGVVTATGMAAILAVLQLLEPDDLAVAPHDCYSGSWRLFTALAGKGCFRLEVVDQRDEAQLDRVLARNPRLVWIETPSNPLLRITDINAVARRAKRHGALVVADNTFLSPARQQPLSLGADIVVHSTTKYLNGHSDVVGGAVVCADPELHERLVWWANCLGVTGAPFDSYLTLRGLRTLEPRMQAHERNADAVARYLADSPQVRRVHYPGLASHPGHALARQQQQGFGAMLGIELAGGIPAVRAFLDGLTCFSLAESLGGVESLIAHPATMTHAAMSAAARRAAGIGENLLRLSVGIEDTRDLLRDLEAALQRVRAVNGGRKTA